MSFNPYETPKASTDTKDDLNKLLREIVENKDNIGFSNQKLDPTGETLFDQFFKNDPFVKDILNGNNSNKTSLIKKRFKDFLKTTINQQDLSQYPEDFKNAILAFKDFLNANKDISLDTALSSFSLELGILKGQVTSYNRNIYSNYINENKKKEDIKKEDIKKEDIKNDTNKKNNSSNDETSNDKKVVVDNSISDTPSNTKINRSEYKIEDDYIDAYSNTKTGYQNEKNAKYFNGDEKDKIENIYNDKGVHKVLKKIFDKDDDFKNRTFDVNLGIENGLARIILDLQEKLIESGKEIKGNNTIAELAKNFKSFENIENNTLSKKQTKELIFDILKIKYENDGILKDYKRLTKVFNKAKWSDLITFAKLVESRPNIARTTKERYNNKTLTENSSVNKDNVFEFLCDINSDGNVSADTKRKNKEQFKVGDVGNLFGQQILFTMEQAVSTQEAILGTGKGEEVVVKNISKMMRVMMDIQAKDPDFYKKYGLVQGSDGHLNAQKTALEAVNNKQTLVEFFKKYPDTKGLFLASVEKFAGGSSFNQLDLYDILTGQEAKRLQQIDMTSENENLRRSIDAYIRSNKDKSLQEFVNKRGAVELRETIFQKIMDNLDKISLQISLDPATGYDAFMSEISKTFRQDQHKKKVLGMFNIQTITLGTNGNELKLGYKLGIDNVSKDGRSKIHLSGGPSIYIQKNGTVGASLELNCSVSEQTNYVKASSAPLDDVKNAKYLGVDSILGIKGQVGKNSGAGLFAVLGVNTEKDALMGIGQLERTYQNVSNRIFSLENINSFTIENIKSTLTSRIENFPKDGINGKFVENNKERLKSNIDPILKFLDESGLLNEINKEKKTSQEKQDAISSLLRILQQGNIDQRKSDVVMNLHGKIDFTKFSVGVDFSRWFGSKSASNSVSGTSNTVNGNNTANPIKPNTNDESGGTPSSTTESTGGENRISILGVYVGTRLSTWKNTYLPNSKQLLFTEHEMNTGVSDAIDFEKDLDKYAAYLQGLFNKPGLTVKRFVNLETNQPEDKLEITFKGDPEQETSLEKILNIHYLPGTEGQFIFRNNKLIIGDVGPITAYTTALVKGVDRVLCLGTKDLNKAKRLTGNNLVNLDINPMTFKEVGYKLMDKAKISQSIDNIDKNISTQNLSTTIGLGYDEKNVYKSLFDAEGKLIAEPTNGTNQNPKIEYTDNAKQVIGQQFFTGTFTLLKKSDGSYVLDYSSFNRDNKLYFEFKQAGSIEKTVQSGSIDLSTNHSLNLPSKEDAYTYIENGKGYKQAFKNFTDASIKGNFDNAKNNLLSLIPTDNESYNKLKNGTLEEQQAIVDSYVSLFAYSEYYPKRTVKEMYKVRDNQFIELLNNPGTELKKELLEKRKNILNNINHLKYKSDDNVDNGVETEQAKDIFGYTAFYRHGVDHKGYAPTRMGNINVVKGSVTKLENINSIKQAKKQIISRLDKSPNHQKLLIKQIKKNIKDPNIANLIDEKTLYDLIRTGSLKIPNDPENKLDISNKILKLEVSPVFYFLRECINESIGLQFGKREITESVDSYTGIGTPDTKYASNLYGKSNSIVGDIHSERKDFTVKARKGIPKKAPVEEDQVYKGTSNPTNGTTVADPNKLTTNDEG